MQSVTSKESSLRCPLNEIFRSKGQVRLLRVLAREPGTSFHPSELAALTGLSESGTWESLNRLTRTGVVQRRSTGRTTTFAFCSEGSLAREVARLFEAEGNRADLLAHALRRILLVLDRPPTAAWIRDYLAGWADRLEVGVYYPDLTDHGSGPPVPEELRSRLGGLEEEFQVGLDVRSYSLEDLTDVEWGSSVLVLGELPGTDEGAGEGEASVSGNGRLDPESTEFSRALVALLEENLAVLLRARENLRTRLEERPNGRGHDLWEWQKILDTFSFPRLLHFLESDSPRAMRLRECSPFPQVLSMEEEARLKELARRLQEPVLSPSSSSPGAFAAKP